jgi:hypothetical protein
MSACCAQPDWWELAQKHAHKLSLLAADSSDAAAGEGALFQSPALEAAPLGAWSAPYVEGPKRPPPRYEHATATIGASLYVVGGNCSKSAGLAALSAQPIKRCACELLPLSWPGSHSTLRYTLLTTESAVAAQAGATWGTCGFCTWTP